MNKPQKRIHSLFIPLKHTCVFQYLKEYLSYFLFQNRSDIIFIEVGIFVEDIYCPYPVLVKLRNCPEYISVQHRCFKQRYLLCKPCREHRKSHNFDQTYILFLDMMK